MDAPHHNGIIGKVFMYHSMVLVRLFMVLVTGPFPKVTEILTNVRTKKAVMKKSMRLTKVVSPTFFICVTPVVSVIFHQRIWLSLSVTSAISAT